MPRPPRFAVVHNIEAQPEGTSEVIPGSGLAFPIICKPVEACGKCWGVMFLGENLFGVMHRFQIIVRLLT